MTILKWNLVLEKRLYKQDKNTQGTKEKILTDLAT